MLVKLATVWVDPAKVVSISYDKSDVVRVDINIVTTDGVLQDVGKIDVFAATINKALQSSSYGGISEEESILP